MKLFHNISVSVFIKEEEDYEVVKENFLKLFPFSLEEEKIGLSESKASTFNDKKITILEVRFTRNRQINEMMDFTKDKLSDSDKEMLVRQIDSRVDEETNFFFRLSKSKWINDEKYVVVDHGDCFHFRCHVATYPQNKEKAEQIVVNYLKD